MASRTAPASKWEPRVDFTPISMLSKSMKTAIFSLVSANGSLKTGRAPEIADPLRAAPAAQTAATVTPDYACSRPELSPIIVRVPAEPSRWNGLNGRTPLDLRAADLASPGWGSFPRRARPSLPDHRRLRKGSRRPA